MTKPDESPWTNRCVVLCLTLTVILTMFGTVAGCTYAQQENVVKAGEGQGRQSAGYENEVVEEHPEVNSGGELWTDIQRQTHRLFAKDTSRFCVLTFVTTHCPVANAYQPVLRQLQEDFAEDRIDFYQINPTRSATSSQALQHTAEFEITMPMILDTKQVIARRVQAKVTPETFLISPRGDVLYHGRIDNLYAGFGKRRQSATVHDLRDAITAALTGQPIASSSTKSVGCFIQYERHEHPLPVEK